MSTGKEKVQVLDQKTAYKRFEERQTIVTSTIPTSDPESPITRLDNPNKKMQENALRAFDLFAADRRIYLNEWLATFGDRVETDIAGKKTILLSKAKDILSSLKDSTLIRAKIQQKFEFRIGRVLGVEGARWKEGRKRVERTMNRDAATSYIPPILETFHTHLTQWQEKLEGGETLPAIDVMYEVFQDIVQETLFRGMKLEEGVKSNFSQLMQRYAGMEQITLIAPAFMRDVVGTIAGRSQYLEFMQIRDQVYAELGDFIVNLWENDWAELDAPQPGQEDTRYEKFGVFAGLFDSLDDGLLAEQEYKDGKITKEEYAARKYGVHDAIADATGVVTAAFETTAHDDLFALTYLAQNPEEWQKLREQSMAILCDENGKLKPLDQITAEDIAALTVAECNMLETARLKPPVPVVLREVAGEEGFDVDGVNYKKSSNVSLMVAKSHRDEREWGADAPKYRSDRMYLLTQRPQTLSKPDQEARKALNDRFFAFLKGAHQCAGEHLGRLEGKIGLALMSVLWPTLDWLSEPGEVESIFAATNTPPAYEIVMSQGRVGLRLVKDRPQPEEKAA
jgi:cytochrome P450